jgi:hypothetical protein
MSHPIFWKPLKHARLLLARPAGAVRDMQYRIRFLRCKLRSGVDSLIGHWRSHTGRVDIGPAFRRLPDGSLQPEPRTIARSQGIDNEWAKFPWLDLADRQIFLDGFLAGELYGRGISCSSKEIDKPFELS